ncbi:VOC family protein [Micromonospora okii]|uniref:VOC family protein n=1 Tax=Micromonospora okii TaxID=1182970 RepID=UPI001E340CA2|nr:VOC family protein [Micromonospora okii]
MIARFKDLCMDACDVPRLAGFWAGVLGGRVVDVGGGDARVDVSGRADAESIWVNGVPEPRTAKTRVHLDLRLAEAEPTALLAAGARLIREPDVEIDWWVLADPEGNQFCAFPPRPGAAPGPFELVVDSADPAAQATWWAGVVGGRVETTEDGTTVLLGAGGFPWRRWGFEAVAERKRVKNRVHWDVDLAGPDATRLIVAGAALLREPDDDISWWVLADPEGNEFCAFAPRTAA